MFKRNLSLLLLALLTVSCQHAKNSRKTSSPGYSFFIGTYTDTESKGIYKATINGEGCLKLAGLQAQTENPSFLALANQGHTLLAVNEINSENGAGTVESYKVGEHLDLIDRETSGGAHPCFVGVNEKGFVLTANYTGGNLGLLKVSEDGKLSELLDVQQHIGKGSNVARQEKAHAHSVWFQPNGNRIIGVDLGTNELWLSKLDEEKAKLMPEKKNRLSKADGAGPRHLCFHPNGKWIYVLNELDNTVSRIVIEEDNSLKLIDHTGTLPDNFKGTSLAADIHISSDGKFLYTSNRGHNSIAIFKVDASGAIKLIGHESTKGDHPRNFALSPDEEYLLVANQNTNNINSYKRNKKTGLLQFVDELKVAKPVCIVFE